MRSVVVQPGQTLADISIREKGTISAMNDISAMNGISPTSVVVPGQLLNLPDAKYRNDISIPSVPEYPKTVVVQPGQTLADIALKYFGSLAAWSDLATLNGISYTDNLTAGSSIFLPIVNYSSDVSTSPVTAKQMIGIVVQPGQTLADISVQWCGSADAWANIASLNGISITDELVAGDVLLVPVATDKRTAKFFKDGQFVPASGNASLIEGIDYWFIELDFKIG